MYHGANRCKFSATMWTLWSDGTYEYGIRQIHLVLLADMRSHASAETNRKCPRWAEFNSGAAPTTPSAGAGASPQPPANLPNLGFNRGPSASVFGHPAAVPSPLAMSPPMSAVDDDIMPPTPSASGPKIKLTLKRT